MIITIIIILTSGQLLTAQTANVQSIDAGGESTTGTMQTVYTIGETVVTEFSGTSIKASEGFINDITVEGSLSLGENTPEIAVKPYPNPTQNYIHLDYPKATTVHYIVVDSLGKVVVSQQCSGNKHRLNLSQLSQGIFFVKAITNKKELGIVKIINK